jgi:predicted XRE-type DNA-binding protein
VHVTETKAVRVSLLPDDGEDGETALADFIGNDDGALELVEDFHALAPMIADLDERSRKILHWRFVEELTQAQIAERLGVSQMHVSRLLSRTLAQLRKGMLTNRSSNTVRARRCPTSFSGNCTRRWPATLPHALSDRGQPASFTGAGVRRWRRRGVQESDAGGDALADRLPLRCEALGDGHDDLQTVLAHPSLIAGPG